MDRRFACVSVLVLALLVALLALPASGDAQVWTHSANSCAVDDRSLSRTGIGGVWVDVHGGGEIQLRCNVVSPSADGQPSWAVLDVVYLDPPPLAVSPNRVVARLMRLGNDGSIEEIARLNSNDFPQSTSPQMQSVTFAHAFDFGDAAYFVEAWIRRGPRTIAQSGPPLVFPRLYLVRLRPLVLPPLR